MNVMIMGSHRQRVGGTSRGMCTVVIGDKLSGETEDGARNDHANITAKLCLGKPIKPTPDWIGTPWSSSVVEFLDTSLEFSATCGDRYES